MAGKGSALYLVEVLAVVLIREFRCRKRLIEDLDHQNFALVVRISSELYGFEAVFVMKLVICRFGRVFDTLLIRKF